MAPAELQEALEWEAAGKPPETAAPIPSGDLRPLIEHLANCFEAMLNCRKSGNEEWEAIHLDRLGALCREHLPSGSGFDDGTRIELDESRLDRLIFATAFHHMDDSGSYDGWTQHRVIVIPAFVGIQLKVTGRDRRGIKDYIADTFADMLRATCRLSDMESPEYLDTLPD